MQLKKRKYDKEQRKMDLKSFITAEQEKTVKIVHQVMLVKKTLTFIYLKYLTKERKNCKKSGLLLAKILIETGGVKQSALWQANII